MTVVVFRLETRSGIQTAPPSSLRGPTCTSRSVHTRRGHKRLDRPLQRSGQILKPASVSSQAPPGRQTDSGCADGQTLARRLTAQHSRPQGPRSRDMRKAARPAQTPCSLQKPLTSAAWVPGPLVSPRSADSASGKDCQSPDLPMLGTSALKASYLIEHLAVNLVPKTPANKSQRMWFPRTVCFLPTRTKNVAPDFEAKASVQEIECLCFATIPDLCLSYILTALYIDFFFFSCKNKLCTMEMYKPNAVIVGLRVLP